MELLICVIFFTLCAAICVKTFASSYSLSKKSSDLSGSVLATQSIAEVYKAENGNLDKVLSLFPTEKKDNSIKIYYNNKWNVSSDNSLENYIIIYETGENEALIEAHKNNTEVFSIKVKAIGG